MRQLLPHHLDEVEPAGAHAELPRPAPPGRPWVLLNMVASADGATAIAGDTDEMGGEADRIVFSAIRALPDVILAAAGTVRADGYGPPRTPATRRRERLARGQAEYPRIAIVSRSLDLDEQSRLFTESPERPIIYTTVDASPQRVSALEPVADVVRFETDSVSATDVTTHLAGLGVSTLLVEGGPSLNGRFLQDGLIDELNLTVAPEFVGGTSSRVIALETEMVTPMRLAHLWEADGVLLCRYVRT